MKNILRTFSISCLLLAGCSKQVKVDFNIKGANEYSLIYMPRANSPVVEKVSITDTVYDLTYSAYLGGSLPAPNNIPVKFGVIPSMVDSFNLANGTHYLLLPAASYTLQNADAEIPAGGQRTEALQVSIKPGNDLLPFETYVLPVSITEAGARINNTLKTTYFLITGSYAPGEVPREKAYAFGPNAGKIMFDFNGDLIRRDPAGPLLLYPKGSGVTFDAPKQIGVGWDIFDMVFYYGGNRLIGRWASGGGDLTQYEIDANGNFGSSKTVGFGWGIFAKIIPYKGVLLGIDAAGNMTQYPLEATDFNYGGIKGIGSGWNIFSQIIPYQNSLLALAPNGDMYQYPLSEDGVFGAPSKVGSGWDMYTLVFAQGTDLLALDANGDLWRYKFNPAGLWPLKK